MAVPELVYAQASPVSIGGGSLFDVGGRISRNNVYTVTSHHHIIRAALTQLRQAGFQILHVSPLAINIAGPPHLFERVFHTRIVEREIDVTRGATATHLDTEHTEDTGILGLISTADTSFAGLIEGVALEVPRYYFSESPHPPAVDYWHFQVPRNVALAVHAGPLYQYGVTGQGVRVAMVDSGWYRHAFFREQGYNVTPVVLGPGAVNPNDDESGHGTGESANILAIAPGCELIPVKMDFRNTIGAFNAAVELEPDIITCSWGSNSPFTLSAADMALAASVSAAVARGITVIFAAGNGHAGFPGQHPDVISVGGVYQGSDGSLQASNYASAFSSQIYPGREVPDVCGLVGMMPKAIYIMLPVQPGDNIDIGNSNNIFPNGDQTAPTDGWAAFSGTSAAAPQLAGVAALMKQVAPNISPALLKAILMYTARDVVAGISNAVLPLNAGLLAGPGPDGATGAGLVDAYLAVLVAYWAAASGLTAFEAPSDPLTAAYMKSSADAAMMLNAYANF